MIIVRLAGAILTLALAGAAPALLLYRGRTTRPLAFLASSFVLGFGLVGLLSVLIMALGGKTGPLLPLAAATAGAALLLRFRPAFSPATPRDRWVLAAQAGSALAVALALAWAASTDHLGWDAEAFWSLKGLAIERHGTFRCADFLGEIRPHYHPRYPLLVPSVFAWIYEATGSTSGHALRLLMALFYAASLVVMSEYLHERVPARLAALLTTAYAFTPAIHSGSSGGAISGYADYPLAVFMLIATVEARRWMEDRRASTFTVAALALAFATQTKDEGAAFTAVLAGVLAISVGRHRGLRGALEGAALALPAVVVAGTWFLASRALPADSFNVAASVGMQWSRTGGVLSSLASMLLRFKEWGLLWPAAALVFCLRFPKLREAESALIWAALGMMAVYVGVWLAFPAYDARSAMKHNAVRLVMHLYPLAFLWTAGRLPTFPGLTEGIAPR